MIEIICRIDQIIKWTSDLRRFIRFVLRATLVLPLLKLYL